ncbi:hypothetical protein CDD83_10841 [Cordyceps sp. RAO-2017]|nr:hypothetical protein CDD83_10841 [Cordyceps sp. RAO-2017]
MGQHGTAHGGACGCTGVAAALVPGPLAPPQVPARPLFQPVRPLQPAPGLGASHPSPLRLLLLLLLRPSAFVPTSASSPSPLRAASLPPTGTSPLSQCHCRVTRIARYGRLNPTAQRGVRTRGTAQVPHRGWPASLVRPLALAPAPAPAPAPEALPHQKRSCTSCAPAPHLPAFPTPKLSSCLGHQHLPFTPSARSPPARPLPIQASPLLRTRPLLLPLLDSLVLASPASDPSPPQRALPSIRSPAIAESLLLRPHCSSSVPPVLSLRPSLRPSGLLSVRCFAAASSVRRPTDKQDPSLATTACHGRQQSPRLIIHTRKSRPGGGNKRPPSPRPPSSSPRAVRLASILSASALSLLLATANKSSSHAHDSEAASSAARAAQGLQRSWACSDRPAAPLSTRLPLIRSSLSPGHRMLASPPTNKPVARLHLSPTRPAALCPSRSPRRHHIGLMGCAT